MLGPWLQADAADFEVIWELFLANRDIFPHVRSDKIKLLIQEGRVRLRPSKKGLTVVTYHIAKRNQRLGRVTEHLFDGKPIMVPKGSCVLHQIVTENQGEGVGSRALQEFMASMGSDTFLNVREDNSKAIAAYQKVGMCLIGSISWADGKVRGSVYQYKSDRTEYKSTF